MTDKKIAFKECMHARYFENQHNEDDDMLLLKMRYHYEDGSSESGLEKVYNYERDFFITHPAHRNHKEKKEWEKKEKLQRFTTTQRKLVKRIRQALGQYPQPNDRIRDVCNQYVYGCDTSTAVWIKHQADLALAKAGRNPSPMKIMALDLETDTVRGTGEIITGAIVDLKRVYCYYTKNFTRQGKLISDLVTRSKEKTVELLRPYINIDEIEVIVEEVENPEDVTIQLLNRAHEFKPDLLAIWNMTFDIKKMEESLVNAGLDPANYFSDPSVEPAYRYFKFNEAPRIKKMASGKVMSKHNADLWHVVEAPSSFYVVDAMCFYKLARVAKGMESSYALDYILKRNKLGGKLHFDIGEMPMLEWHQKMSTEHKAEYIAYNIYDCLSMCQLDAKTNDLSMILPILCGHSELAGFTSTPRRLSDDMEFICRSKGLVFGTTSSSMVAELDAKVVDMSGWIVTLPNQNMTACAGINILGDGYEGVPSGVVGHGSDSDAKAAYPSTTIAMNISKETTVAELYAIQGQNSTQFRKTAINMTAARTNAVQAVEDLYKAPGLLELGSLFDEFLKVS